MMKVIFAGILLSSLAPLAALPAADLPRSKPNVLLIITDDQGYGDLSIHGNTHLQTPHIDRLGAESVRFDRFYVNSFCAPTRASLLTGRWPLRTGCHGVTHNREAMKPSEVTMAEALHAGGCRSTCIGKWHNGEQYPFTPLGEGFDEAFGFNNGHWNNYFDPVLLRGKTSVHEGGTRVPLFVRWPAAKWQPHLVKPIVSHIDLFPTLLDLCGVNAPAGPKVDGITLRPLLEKADPGDWPERSLFTHNPISETNKFPGAVRTQRYRLVREIKGPAGGSKAKANDASATPWQLYDMEGDPGETKDIAADHPDIVKQLSAEYDAWFADISRDALQRFPLPIGHAAHNPVELHAPQAYLDKPLTFANGPGFANDWLTGWTDPKAKVWFDIDVVTAGDYEIELALACPPADAGSRLRIAVGSESTEAAVPAANAPETPLPHRDEAGKSRCRNREWTHLQVGTLKLPKGPAQLTLEALTMPGMQVMELKHVKLNLRSSP